MKPQKIKKLTLAAVFAALITVSTAFFKIPTGINEGYIHIGDSLIYTVACLLGPLSLPAAAIGGALADILSGAAVWAIPTAIIKALNCIPFLLMGTIRPKSNKIINIFSITASLVSGFITVLGYMVAEWLLYSLPSSLASIPFSIIQASVAIVVFIIIGFCFDRINIKKFL